MQYIKLIFLFFIWVSLIKNAKGQDGSFDSTFGVDGGLVFSIADKDDFGRTLAVLNDDKIVTAGWYNLIDNLPINRHIYFTKHLPNGDLDTTFGSNGIVNLTIGSEGSSISEIEVQSDGKIVGFGNANGNAILLRLNIDGTLDSSFGSNGVTNMTSGASFEILDNGKFIVSGGVSDGFNVFFSISRYFEDGTLDTSFGDNGTVVADISPERFDLNASIEIQEDGKMVLVGTTYTNATERKAIIARYLTDGTLDLTFGGTGFITTSVGITPGYGIFSDVAIQEDGKIIAAGLAEQEVGGGLFDTQSLLVRYNQDGTLDENFGTDGIILTDTATNGNSLINSIIVQPDNYIVAIGSSAEPPPSFQSYVTCMKYNSSGILESNFGNNGIFISDFLDSETNTGYDLVLQATGKIVGIGVTNEPSSSSKDIALFRLNNELLNIRNFDIFDSIVVYPNPASKKLNVRLKEGVLGLSLRILNTYGQLLYEGAYLNEINVVNFQSGTYIVEIYTDKGSAFKKVIFD
jgi:uncharacterized delta-60 repeat protein